MTVRETLDFSARLLGVGSHAETMNEVLRREKQTGIIPEPDIDTYMKAISEKGLKINLQTDYNLKILGLDICADTIVGDAMRTGISGGQKKRLTIGEMLVGPSKTLFMDEISTGLDSPTTYQTVNCIQQLSHITNATVLVSLLQPAPEIFELFDDIILMSEGKIVYQVMLYITILINAPSNLLCFTQVLSRKNQEQYWYRRNENYSYFTIDDLSEKFKLNHIGQVLDEDLLKPYDKTESHKNALSFKNSFPNWEILKACMSREVLMRKRNLIVYIFKTFQSAVASATSSSFIYLAVTLFCGFILPLSSTPAWLKWGFWSSPIAYAEIGLSVNEFLAPRWQEVSIENGTVGQEVLRSHGLNFKG